MAGPERGYSSADMEIEGEGGDGVGSGGKDARKGAGRKGPGGKEAGRRDSRSAGPAEDGAKAYPPSGGTSEGDEG